MFSVTDKKKDYELPLFEATKIIRHAKIKSLSNPYDKDWENYFKEREKRKQNKYQQIINSKKDFRASNVAFRVLEPCEVKVSCTVLRGERESNLPDLLDVRSTSLRLNQGGFVYGGFNI